MLSHRPSQSHRRRCPVFLLSHLSFLPFSPPSRGQRNCTTTLSVVFAPGALLPFSLVKSSPSRISLWFSCPFSTSVHTRLLLTQLPSLSLFLFSFFYFVLLSPSMLSAVLFLLAYLHSSRIRQTRISFFFRSFQH